MSPSRGEQTRDQILATAMDLSSAEGLSGLSIARLARETGLSKSGLFAHFGSKQELQLAAVRYAAQRFERDVIERARAAEAGLPRLRAMLSSWVDSIEGTGNRGGCFFDAASSEYASRRGEVRDLLAWLSRSWLTELEAQARLAVRLGELARDVDPELLAFQLHAYVEEANWSHELFGDERGFDKARAAIENTLRASLPSASDPERSQS